LAVQLAKVHGVSRTAAVLGPDYHNLKKRAEAVTSEPRSSPLAVVALPAPVPVGNLCGFELDNGAPPRSHRPIQVQRTQAS
jgi:hypothetical protein